MRIEQWDAESRFILTPKILPESLQNNFLRRYNTFSWLTDVFQGRRWKFLNINDILNGNENVSP